MRGDKSIHVNGIPSNDVIKAAQEEQCIYETDEGLMVSNKDIHKGLG